MAIYWKRVKQNYEIILIIEKNMISNVVSLQSLNVFTAYFHMKYVDNTHTNRLIYFIKC